MSTSFLFPTPSLHLSGLTPSRFPGVSPDSTITLQNVLKDNHTKWHTFFNDQRFHNHAAHRAIAAWALGAGGRTIQTAYERDCGYEKPAFKSPGEINTDNFHDHLGDDRYFESYKRFFTSYVKEKGIPASIEDFVLSQKANLGGADLPKEKQPQMLSRFLNGVLHPLIHTGYGAEFTLPGMVVEGLAQTAVHFSSPLTKLLDALKLFEGSDKLHDSNVFTSAGQALRNALDQAVTTFEGPTTSKEPSTTNIQGLHALSILSRVLNDSQFFASKAAVDDENNMFEHTIHKHGDALAYYVNQWRVRGETVDSKIEELAWTVCVLYGVAGWTHSGLTEGKKFNADFFFMHLITSSIFLPALCAVLPPESQVRLLKAYFATALAWAVARGRPPLDVKGFAEALQDSASLKAPSTPTWESIWLRMIEEARVHHDEHVTKIIRALAAWSSAFGTRKSRATLLSASMRNAERKISIETESQGAGLAMDTGDPGESTTGQPGSTATTITGAADFRQSDIPPSEDMDCTSGANAEENVLPQTELPGSEYLDGRLFTMVAILTLNRMGWELDGKVQKNEWEKKEGQRDEEEFWDFVGFFPPDANPRL